MTVNQISVFTPFTKGTQNQLVLASGQFLFPGDCQIQMYSLGNQTLDATPTSLLTDVTVPTSKIILKNYQSVGFQVFIWARASISGDSAFFRLSGMIKRGANAASTVMVDPENNINFANDAAWSCDAVADTTNGALDITVTGAAGTFINWAANVTTYEVIAQ